MARRRSTNSGKNEKRMVNINQKKYPLNEEEIFQDYSKGIYKGNGPFDEMFPQPVSDLENELIILEEEQFLKDIN